MVGFPVVVFVVFVRDVELDYYLLFFSFYLGKRKITKRNNHLNNCEQKRKEGTN